MPNDHELESLFSIVHSLKSGYVNEEDLDIWKDSPFAWIKTRPSRQVGKIGEQIVAVWCKQKGFDVSRSGNSDADLVINGHPVEVKFSTLWKNNHYTFQQLRDQEYDYAFLLGISPNAAHGWFVSKNILRRHVIGHTPQHAGRKGLDTFWISFNKDNPHLWLQDLGGTMSQVFTVIQKEIGQ